MQVILFRARKVGVKFKALGTLLPGTQTYLRAPKGHGKQSWEMGSFQVPCVLKLTDISF